MTKRTVSRLLIVVWTLVFSLALLTLVSAQDSAPYLGISFEAVDEGVLVTTVAPDSPAESAGLETGDIITAIDDEAVTAETIAEVVGGYAVDDSITLTVTRDDESLELEVALAERPEGFAPARPNRPGQPEILRERAYLCVALNDADNVVVIAEVAADSPAESAGLQVDDVLVSINDTAVTTAAEAVELIRALSPGDTVTLEIERDGEAETLEIELGAMDRMGLLPLDLVMYDADSESWLVVALAEDSPLAAAGVENGDEITGIALDGEPLTVNELDEALANAADDAGAELTIERGDETLTVSLSAADLRSGFAFQRGSRMGGMGDRGMMPFGGHMMGGNVRLGVSYTMLDADLAAENDLDISEGALINEVLDDSPAATAGLQAGDVITAVDGDVVDARRDLRERLYAYEPGDVVTLDVLRDGENLALEATLEAGEMNFNFGELPFEFELPLPPAMPEADPALPVT